MSTFTPTEEEEFAFRYRYEQEQRAKQGGGMASEVGKAAGRAALGIPNMVVSAGDWLEKKMPTPEWSKVQDTGNVRGALTSANQNLKATPANRAEQMVGTGVEIGLGAAMLPVGGPMSVAQRGMSIAAPALGGVVGEQLGGEGGKLAGTLLAPFAAAGVSRAVAPQVSDSMRSMVNKGVTPSMGQMTGRWGKALESLPIVNRFAGIAEQRATTQFNRATLNHAIAPIGGKVDDVGYTGFQQAWNQASRAYDDVLGQVGPVKYDFAMDQDLRTAYEGIKQHPKAQEALVKLFNENVRPTFVQNKRGITADQMKQVDSDLGDMIRRYERSGGVKNGYIADGLSDVQLAIRNSVARQYPQHAEALQKANTAWAGLKRVEKATLKADTTDGVFTPGQLMKAVKESETRKSQFAKGKSLMQDIAREGVDVLGTPTAQGGGIPLGLMTGNKATMGLMGAGALAAVPQSMVPYMINRPQAVQRIGEMMYPGSKLQAIGGAIPGLFDDE